MKPITIGSDDFVLTEQCELIGRFGVAHGLTTSIQVGVGIGYPIFSVGDNFEVI